MVGIRSCKNEQHQRAKRERRMFKRIASWLAASAGSVATKYALRASVAIPFLLAGGFGIAGLTVFLIDHFGSRDAYLLLAAGFAMCGLLAMLITLSRFSRAPSYPARWPVA